MSTSLHALLIAVLGNVYFVVVIFNSCGRKMRFSESTQKSPSEKSIFGIFEVNFLMYDLFPGRGWFFTVSTFK